MKTTAYLRNLVYVIIAAALLWIAAYVTVRHLGTVFSGMEGLLGADAADTLGGIFGGLRSAVVRPGAVVLFISGAVFLLLRFLCPKPWIYAQSPLFLLIGYLGAIVFARVNDVLFYDILRTLIKLIDGGLLNLL